MKKALLLCALGSVFLGSQVAKSQTSITFDSAFADGTNVSTQVPGVTFSLTGSGPITSGSPVVDYFWGGLMNAPAITSDSVDYPTATTIDIVFSAPVDDLSFTFNNYGDNGTSSFSAYDASHTLVDTANISGNSSFATETVTGSDITNLLITNGEPGTDWGFAVGNLTYSETPEPGSLVLLGTSVLGAAGALRRRFRA